MATEPRAVLVVTIEVDAEDEADFNRWYDTKHVPERLAMPGFLSARRYASTDRPGRYLAVYELSTPEAALSDAYMDMARSLETPWDKAVHATWTHMHREVWTLLQPDS
jgi:hypothetical protein